MLPPFIAHGIPFVGPEVMQAEVERLRARLQNIDATAPLFFHGSDEIADYRLKPEVEPATPGQHRGPRRHITD